MGDRCDRTLLQASLTMPLIENGLGCIIEPPMLGASNVEIVLGTNPLPEEFIVSSWRNCFDAIFHDIPAMLAERIEKQADDDCVGRGFAVQKSAQEKKKISARDIFRIAKTLDGYGINSYGTTLAAGADAVVGGVAEEELVPSDRTMPRAQYVSQADVTPEVIANRAKHKGRSPFSVPRTVIQRALFELDLPLVTSSMWYQQDNDIGPDGLMAMPVGSPVAGHAFTCIGWVMRMVGPDFLPCLVMVTKFGPDWGHNGIFFVPLRDVVNRLTNAHVVLDMPLDLASILAQYNGRDVLVMGSPEHWLIENGKRRKYPDEIVWWAHGKLFGIDVFEIDPDDLLAIPEGPPMSIDDAPFKNRELIRQIRQSLGAL